MVCVGVRPRVVDAQVGTLPPFAEEDLQVACPGSGETRFASLRLTNEANLYLVNMAYASSTQKPPDEFVIDIEALTIECNTLGVTRKTVDPALVQLPLNFSANFSASTVRDPLNEDLAVFFFYWGHGSSRVLLRNVTLETASNVIFAVSEQNVLHMVCLLESLCGDVI